MVSILTKKDSFHGANFVAISWDQWQQSCHHDNFSMRWDLILLHACYIYKYLRTWQYRPISKFSTKLYIFCWVSWANNGQMTQMKMANKILQDIALEFSFKQFPAHQQPILLWYQPIWFDIRGRNIPENLVNTLSAIVLAPWVTGCHQVLTT